MTDYTLDTCSKCKGSGAYKTKSKYESPCQNCKGEGLEPIHYTYPRFERRFRVVVKKRGRWESQSIHNELKPATLAANEYNTSGYVARVEYSYALVHDWEAVPI